MYTIWMELVMDIFDHISYKNGQLKIIDRVKHIFKLSQGEYVAPECVENEYIRTEGVAQIFVHGESLQVSYYCFHILNQAKAKKCNILRER